MVDDEDGALRRNRVEDRRRAHAAQPDAVVDVARRAEGVAVTGVGRHLDAADEEQIVEALLLRCLPPLLRDGVVVGELDEIEPARARQLLDLGERGRRVAALLVVDVEVALVPGRPGGEHARGERGARHRRQRGRIAKRHVDRVVARAGGELGLADDQGPRAGDDRPRQVAARRHVHADDRRGGEAAAPAAEAVRRPHAPVEDDHVGAVGVIDLDLGGAGRDGERDQGVVAVAGGDVGLEVERRRGEQHGQEEGAQVRTTFRR
jgi:hypothetical protein